MPRISQTQRTARERLMRDLIYLQQESWIPATISEEIPSKWHTLDWDIETPEDREKVTLYLDRSVARFFRAMGKGYHRRINRLLATYVEMHLAKELRMEEALKQRIAEREEAEKAKEGEHDENESEKSRSFEIVRTGLGEARAESRP